MIVTVTWYHRPCFFLSEPFALLPVDEATESASDPFRWRGAERVITGVPWAVAPTDPPDSGAVGACFFLGNLVTKDVVRHRTTIWLVPTSTASSVSWTSFIETDNGIPSLSFVPDPSRLMEEASTAVMLVFPLLDSVLPRWFKLPVDALCSILTSPSSTFLISTGGVEERRRSGVEASSVKLSLLWDFVDNEANRSLLPLSWRSSLVVAGLFCSVVERTTSPDVATGGAADNGSASCLELGLDDVDSLNDYQVVKWRMIR